MTAQLLLSALDPTTLAWLPAVFAAASGIGLQLLLPPPNSDVAEALLVASVHP